MSGEVCNSHLVPQVNLALRGLPVFSCLPQPVGQHRTTTHLLPDEDVIGSSMDQVGAHSLVATSGPAG
jgi:hypothetical protein